MREQGKISSSLPLFFFFLLSPSSIETPSEKMSSCSRRPFRMLAPAGGKPGSDALTVNGERVPDPPGFSAAVAVRSWREKKREFFFHRAIALDLLSDLDLDPPSSSPPPNRPPPRAPPPPPAAAQQQQQQQQRTPPSLAERRPQRSRPSSKRGRRRRSSPSASSAS